VNAREKWGLGDTHEVAELLADGRDEVVAGAIEEVVAVAGSDEGAEENAVVAHAVRELGPDPGAGRKQLSLDSRNQEAEAVKAMAESGAVVTQRHGDGGVVGDDREQVAQGGIERAKQVSRDVRRNGQHDCLGFER
jgi:hypothetical protein